jgi:hypothetical protein
MYMPRTVAQSAVLCIVILYAIVGCSKAAPSSETVAETTVGITGGSVNMREGPSANYAVVTVVPAGSTVTVTGGAEEDWVEVEFEGKRGYMSRSLLTLETRNQTVAAESGKTAKTGTGETGPDFLNRFMYQAAQIAVFLAMAGVAAFFLAVPKFRSGDVDGGITWILIIVTVMCLGDIFVSDRGVNRIAIIILGAFILSALIRELWGNVLDVDALKKIAVVTAGGIALVFVTMLIFDRAVPASEIITDFSMEELHEQESNMVKWPGMIMDELKHPGYWLPVDAPHNVATALSKMHFHSYLDYYVNCLGNAVIIAVGVSFGALAGGFVGFFGCFFALLLSAHPVENILLSSVLPAIMGIFAGTFFYVNRKNSNPGAGIFCNVVYSMLAYFWLGDLFHKINHLVDEVWSLILDLITGGILGAILNIPEFFVIWLPHFWIGIIGGSVVSVLLIGLFNGLKKGLDYDVGQDKRHFNLLMGLVKKSM